MTETQRTCGSLLTTWDTTRRLKWMRCVAAIICVCVCVVDEWAYVITIMIYVVPNLTQDPCMFF